MYAGFWKRFGAYIIDCIILTVVYYLVLFVFGLVGLGIGAASGNDWIMGVGILIAVIVLTPLYWLYFALFESSKFQATPGKLALGIIVVGPNQQRISFLRATGRFFSKILSGMIFYIGFIMAGFTSKKQALHDMICETYTLNKNAVQQQVPPPPQDFASA